MFDRNVFMRCGAAVAGVLLALSFASSSRAVEISWEDLPDESVQSYEDPYRDLNYDQISALRTMSRVADALKSDDLPAEARPRLETQREEAVAFLQSQGLDADWLISQRWVVAERRRRAWSDGNPALDGSEATLSGYIIPAAPDAEGRPTAYLVPERGMCSHVPPPPPNQLLRLVFEEPWRPRFFYQPVKVTGRLEIDPSQRVMQVLDGPVRMASTFRLDVAGVTELTAEKQASEDRRSASPIQPLSSGGKTGGVSN
ncbi:DUF3299 domain-containing protein [Rhodovibrionaceae bacterium A322]